LFIRFTKLVSVFFVLFSVGVLGSTESVASEQLGCTASQGGGYVVARDDQHDSVLVFVHGLGGDSIATWTSGLFVKTYWPCLLKSDSAFKGTNVFAYEYPTSLFAAKAPIGRVATQLYADLSANGVFNHKNVTFVVHSLGGLATSRMLLELHNSPSESHKAALLKVRHVMFYGVPADGNELASVVRYLGGGEHVKDIADTSRSEATLSRWRNVRWPFTFSCLAEGGNVGFLMFGSKVVSEKSAFSLCEASGINSGGQKIHLDSLDHSAIVKPASHAELPHKRLLTDYLLCVAPFMANNTPTSAPESGRTKAVRTWYDRLVLQLSAKVFGQTDSDVFSGLFANNSHRTFLAPVDGAIGTFRVARGINVFVDELASQVPVRIVTSARDFVPILNVSKLGELPKIVRDRSVIELIKYAQLNLDTTPEALVLVVGNKNPGFPSVLFVFDEKSDGAEDPALRGFVVLPARSECASRL
jgi:pimeloyl-ACP methyl ester carboxylesterase